MTIFNKKFASQYKSLPVCNPDFIYLDGPSPFTVKKKINGFSTNHPDLMPMSCDILKFEHFLCPGTIILVDGRTANARFLQKNFQRNWEYFHDEENDQNLFYLNEKNTLINFNLFYFFLLTFFRNKTYKNVRWIKQTMEFIFY